ncbi:hypothetical protein PTSG_04479 [Salpingoeca rosetta]|uniref:IMS import disulfide relay-system CHCH-CHCH-like Cx9C domain-containing protein n=1 Tax=Salpingoeca rosetta (strain ATCC 50818 / BSB-021) TaxID=946362 RepID=F2U8P1_SALR5|nr:uncharacterized protein PTSG_04479 [Salpingoeca rosetta]EGD72749.1 hypothetical protein PTSG_04479 [Salpingoeca rosetta]|eukprot:XP_004994572.1 hypothetical protein PTSG_04479 [Salpingoeca rosetta]
MDRLLDAVEASCRQEVEAFHKCAEVHGNDGCPEQKAALQKCSDQSVEYIRSIQRVCKHSLASFQKCVSEHPEDAHIRCDEKVNVFLTCAESVMSYFEKQKAAARSSSGQDTTTS